MLVFPIPELNYFYLEYSYVLNIYGAVLFIDSFNFTLFKEIEALNGLVLDLNLTSDFVYVNGIFLISTIEKISQTKKPLYIYNNFKLNKLEIFRDHTIKKSGIYCLINNINGHFYIGCSTNIKIRMSCYLSNSYLNYKKNNNQPIIKALLKHGQDKFSLIIIEYLLSSVGNKGEEVLFDRESFWILKLNPYYNVLKFGGSSTGYKHSSLTKLLISRLAKGRKLTIDTKLKISESLKGDLNPFYGKIHTENTIEKIIKKKIF